MSIQSIYFSNYSRACASIGIVRGYGLSQVPTSSFELPLVSIASFGWEFFTISKTNIFKYVRSIIDLQRIANSFWIWCCVSYRNIARVKFHDSINFFTIVFCSDSDIIEFRIEDILSMPPTWYSIINNQRHNCLQGVVSISSLELLAQIFASRSVDSATSFDDPLHYIASIRASMLKEVVLDHIDGVIISSIAKAIIQLQWLDRLDRFEITNRLDPLFLASIRSVVHTFNQGQRVVIDKLIQFFFDKGTKKFRLCPSDIEILQDLGWWHDSLDVCSQLRLSYLL